MNYGWLPLTRAGFAEDATHRSTALKRGVLLGTVEGERNVAKTKKPTLVELVFKWTGPELNWRHTAFQAVALPTELPVHNSEQQYTVFLKRFQRFFGEKSEREEAKKDRENKESVAKLFFSVLSVADSF